MRPALVRSLAASLLAGLVAAPAAVVLWPIALLLGGRDIGLREYLGVPAFAVGSVAALFGLAACLLVGWPLLVLLSLSGRNSPAVVACIGGAIGGGFLAIVGGWSFLEAWPLYAFFTTMGGICGAVASKASSPTPQSS